MRKVFIPAGTVRDNAWRLAAKIAADNFYPDVIYIALRGGSNMGNPISEYFKQMRARNPALRRVLFAAVAARSYTGVGEREKVQVDGWTYDPKNLRADDKVLLIDDVFDRGLTVNHLVGEIMNKGVPRGDIKVVVHDYKYRTFLRRHLPIQPDYWCEKHVIRRKHEDPWLHYLSHELEGLTEAEIQEYVAPQDPALARVLLGLLMK